MKAPSVTLSQRLLLLTAAALLPALAILSFNELSLRRVREAEVHAYALRMSELAALELERILTGAGALMVAAANAPVVQAGGDGCQGYMDRLGALLPQILVINITDLDGNSICSNSRDPDDLRPAASADVRAALQNQFFQVGEYTRTSHGPALLLGTQRTAADGTLQGYVLAAIGLDYLGQVLKERPDLSGTEMTIADRNGIYLAREPQPERYVGMQVSESFLPRLQGSAPGTMQVTSDEVEHIVGYQPADRGLGLYVSAGLPLADSMAPINEATLRGLLLAGGGRPAGAAAGAELRPAVHPAAGGAAAHHHPRLARRRPRGAHRHGARPGRVPPDRPRHRRIARRAGGAASRAGRGRAAPRPAGART